MFISKRKKKQKNETNSYTQPACTSYNTNDSTSKGMEFHGSKRTLTTFKIFSENWLSLFTTYYDNLL